MHELFCVSVSNFHYPKIFDCKPTKEKWDNVDVRIAYAMQLMFVVHKCGPFPLSVCCCLSLGRRGGRLCVDRGIRWGLCPYRPRHSFMCHTHSPLTHVTPSRWIVTNCSARNWQLFAVNIFERFELFGAIATMSAFVRENSIRWHL